MKGIRRCVSTYLGAAIIAFGALGAGPVAASAAAPPPPTPYPAPTPYPVSPTPVHMDLSPPLASMQPANYNFESALGNDRGAKPIRHGNAPAVGAAASPSAPSPSAPMPGINFDGVGQGFGSYVVCCAPPDTNASVGPNHIVETVNLDLAVFNKTGGLVYGPVPINTLWSGFGGGCQIDNDGDPTALYDPMADRWLISQFAVTTTHYLNCVAISQTPDPTGAYYRYSYSYSNFPDYPKFGIWPDGYYVTFNMFNGNTFAGGTTCAYDRTKMLTGAAATQQCFNAGSLWGGMLPSTTNGSTLPPAGAVNYVLGLDTPATSNRIAYWKFHVDWTTPASTTMTGPSFLTVSTYTNSCAAQPRGDCIPQGAGGTPLESLADRLMYRLNYRNLGNHEALVVNHTIEVGSGSSLHSGMRWYELRPDAARNLTLFQEGTYAPDSSWRWMGSINMDQAGNIAAGYSVSSSTISPQIHYTGRLATDVAGIMTQGENTIINGGGSQTGGLARWGDYSSLAVDPTDDCTFFHANEYLKASGSFNWSTRIASFKLPSCPATAPTPDFSLSVTPSSQTVTQGASATYTVNITRTGGFTGAVSLSFGSSPTGLSGTFSPNQTTAASSTLTVPTTPSTGTGPYTITVTGTGTGVPTTRTATTSLTVNAPATPDFSLSATPASQTVTQGTAGSYTVNVARSGGFGGGVTLSMSSSPAGLTGTFTPNPNTGASSSLSVPTTSTTPTNTYTITITGTGNVPTHTTTVTLVVNPPAAGDFSLSATPTSRSIKQGTSTTYVVNITRTGGFAGGVNFSVTGLPAGATATFAPTPATAASSTLTVALANTSPIGTYALTITGASGSLSHTTSVTLIVTQGCFGSDGDC
ncbi:MAG TPA: hypothetical protein VFH00_11575 [Candidatus Nitrosotalea sp.]|nr:hypothetical protein [Candidatus Nitrosotalea sp.]